MKYGNFVGKGWMPFDEETTKSLYEHFKSQCEQVFGKDYFSGFRIMVDNEEGEKYANVKHLCFYADVKNPSPVFRNCEGSRIFDHKTIWFFCCKHAKGYLEVTDPKEPWKFPKDRDYDNCPEFSFGCDVNADGYEVVYKGRSKQRFQCSSPYNYGTEIKDLDFISQLRELRRITARN